MKVVARVRLLPSPEQARVLEATPHACNRAANHASQVAQATGARHKYALQEKVYHHLKAEFGLSAQPAVRVIGKVADAYTTRKANLEAGNLGRKGSAKRQRVASTGQRHAGRLSNRHRRRRESRRARDVNHRISKSIVEQAERTGHGIALEDLRGIRGRVRQARKQRSTLHSWGFAQLRDFISCKARRAGVPVVVVDPAYSSQTCSECDHTSRHNRPKRARFVCRGCGVVLHADVNASRNLGHRDQAEWIAGRPSTGPAPSG